jgi:hypothetical protein
VQHCLVGSEMCIRDSFLKEKIKMARPKGSKNKTVEQPKEFDYERDDAMIDGAYQATMITSAEARPDPSWTLIEQPNYTTSPQAFDMMKNTPPPAFWPSDTLFLVEGDVQLSSRIPGNGSMVAKQTRLVNATSDTQAIQKFSAYFSSLSDAESVYTVLRAAAMETIN